MEQTIYFQDKSLTFSRVRAAETDFVIPSEEAASLTRAKILNFFEIHNSIRVLCDDPEVAFRRFGEEFTSIEAAGGVVVNGRGEWLMIRRNNRWDLPKGHVEAGESFDRCAEREIEEETGVKAAVLRPLCDTWHAYFFPKTQRWELKRTHWYLLRSTERGELKPQTEEGIVEVAWCTPNDVEHYLKESYPTIRRVVEALHRVVLR